VTKKIRKLKDQKTTNKEGKDGEIKTRNTKGIKKKGKKYEN